MFCQWRKKYNSLTSISRSGLPQIKCNECDLLFAFDIKHVVNQRLLKSFEEGNNNYALGGCQIEE